MILVDTSVWSHHFRTKSQRLVTLLEDHQVITHPWIIGELALGPGIRLQVLDDLIQLPSLSVVDEQSMLTFIELHTVRGVGWVDLQLLLAALQGKVKIWTQDKRLLKVAKDFKALEL